MSRETENCGRYKDLKNAEEVMSKGHKTISLKLTEYHSVNNDISHTANGSVFCKRESCIDKKDLARRRWRILARALKSPISSQPSSPTDEISVRRFSTFMLLTTEPIDDVIKYSEQPNQENNVTTNGSLNTPQNIHKKSIETAKRPQDDDKILKCSTNRNCSSEQLKIEQNEETSESEYYQKNIFNCSNEKTDKRLNDIQNGKRKQIQYKKRNWFRYAATINDRNFFIDIGHISRSFTAADLIGFNNTGNVCVWPSEEALAYYILNNLVLFNGKKVLELGGGMSALAGLMVAKYGNASFVHLTDGNSLAVENIKSSLERNQFTCHVSCSVLKWGSSVNKPCIYDIILSADCLFFDEARNDLIETIWSNMNADSLALVMAPRRGDTLDIFIAHAQIRGFVCRKIIYYDKVVWERHLECLQNPDYDEDIHYPILMHLTKTN